MLSIILSYVLSTNFLYFLFIIIGVYSVCCYLLDNFMSIVQIIKTILTPYFIPQEDLTLAERYGNWAVITGSTDGIGREYAKELANQGINIVLISRTESKLIEVAKEIESNYRVKTKWIAADFSFGKETYKHIENELQGIPVGILVNNVGRMYDFPDELGTISEKLIWDIMNINIGAVTMMTRMLVNSMKKMGKGAIINISSGSELQPMPLMAVYGASKIYVKNFTLAVKHELSPYGITVQLVTPMYVQTKMNEYSTTVMAGSILVPDVQSYTKSAIFSLGKTDVTTGYWSHGIQYGAMKIVPTWLRTLIALRINKQFREEYFAQNKTKIQ